MNQNGNNSNHSEIRDQPQPQGLAGGSAALNVAGAAVAAAAAAAVAVNGGLLLGGGGPDLNRMVNFSGSSSNGLDWQNSLLSSYNHGQLGGPVALGSQGSASLTSLSDTDNDGNRKRQVRLLKNR